MERYSEVIGLPVICVDDGKMIGVVEDVIFCPRTKEVTALCLERKGCEVSKKIIFLKDVLNLGNDAVVVNDCTCAKSSSKASKSKVLKDKGKVKGLSVYSKTGDNLGIVQDILFDYKTGTIEGIELSDGLFRDIFEGRKIVPIIGKVEFSEESILVEKDAVEEMMNTGGGLKKMLKDKKE